MKGILKTICITVLCVIGAFNTIQAQRDFYYFSAGAQVGTCHYQGDLDDHGFEPWRPGGSDAIKQQLIRPAFGFQLNYHFNPYMFARLAFNQGWIRASDSTNVDPARRWRNLHFQSPITELSLQLVIELRGKNDYYRYRTKWAPYILFGISVFHFNPQAKAEQDWRRRYPRLFPYKDDYYDLQPLGTEGQNLPAAVREQFGLPAPYALWGVAIPFGLGMRFRLNRYWDLRIDVALRKTFTDYLDDVSTVYANPDLLRKYAYNERSMLFADRSGYANFGIGRSTQINDKNYRAHYGAYGYTGEIRGHTKDKDMYGFFNVGITRILK